MSDNATDDGWIWDRFWRYDRLASCLDGVDHGGYDEVVAAGWRDFFASLPDAARILDLCTGNGAVALIAARVGIDASKGFAVSGVDRAAIDPLAHVSKFRDELATIVFHGGVAAERLPFADGAVDAVVSQYGFEYTDMARSAGEVARVLAPGGRFRCVVHAREGIVRSGSAEVVADADFLLDEAALPDRAIAAIAAVTRAERAAAPDREMLAAAQAAFGAFRAALDATAAHLTRARDAVMIGNALVVIRDAYDRRRDFAPAALIAKVEEVRTEIAAQRGRSAALIGAALDADALGVVSALLSGAGLTDVAVAPVRHAGGLIGHAITARRG